MSVADLDALRNHLENPFQELRVNKANMAMVAGGLGLWSTWQSVPFAGAIPTTAAALNNTVSGALFDSVRNLRSDAVGQLRLGSVEIADSRARPGAFLLIDRLSHQGGLSGTDTTAGVTTNLPTAALTRYTDGVGVLAAIEIYTQIGTTATTITCAYTDQSGNGSTSQPVVIGATNNREVGRFIPISLEAGDTGVRAITSSTLAGTTGTAGAFGYVLYKPIALIPTMPGMNTVYEPFFGGSPHMPAIDDNACLQLLHLNTAGVTGTSPAVGKIKILDT